MENEHIQVITSEPDSLLESISKIIRNRFIYLTHNLKGAKELKLLYEYLILLNLNNISNLHLFIVN
jgi:hypothetical protein